MFARRWEAVITWCWNGKAIQLTSDRRVVVKVKSPVGSCGPAGGIQVYEEYDERDSLGNPSWRVTEEHTLWPKQKSEAITHAWLALFEAAMDKELDEDPLDFEESNPNDDDGDWP